MGQLNSLTEERFQRRTQFDEQIMAEKQGGFALMSSWGTSALRDETSTTGTGAQVTSSKDERKF